MGRFALALATLGAFLLAGCSTNTTNSGNSSGSSNGGSAAPKALPPEYRTLAENVSLDIRSDPKQYRDNKRMAEIIAEGHTAVMALRGIKSSDSDITYIAGQSQTACSDAISRLEKINSLPKPPGEGELFVGSFIDGFFFNFAGAYERGKDAEDKQRAIINELQGLIGATDKLDAAQTLLPKVAERYAAPVSSNTGRIRVDFDESWGPFEPHDWLCLYNTGTDLEDCTILVEITGAKGDVRKKVHFLRKWSGNSWQYARYAPGYDLLGRKVGRMTVYNVDTVDVTIFSPKYSTKIHYVYTGAEKDKDVAERCKDATLKWRYQPFEKGIFSNTDRGVKLTLDKIAVVPKCHVVVTFKTAWQSKGYYWDFDYWKQGDEKTFSSSDLLFDPDTIEVVMSFPGTNHRINWTLDRKK
jgi:hypothetical protein